MAFVLLLPQAPKTHIVDLQRKRTIAEILIQVGAGKTQMDG
jgi:hypothetical protein